MSIDGNLVEKAFFAQGIDTDLTRDYAQRDVLNIKGTPFAIGQAWPDEDTDAGWSFDSEDTSLYEDGTFYGQLDASTPEELVEAVLKICSTEGLTLV